MCRPGGMRSSGAVLERVEDEDIVCCGRRAARMTDGAQKLRRELAVARAELMKRDTERALLRDELHRAHMITTRLRRDNQALGERAKELLGSLRTAERRMRAAHAHDTAAREGRLLQSIVSEYLSDLLASNGRTSPAPTRKESPPPPPPPPPTDTAKVGVSILRRVMSAPPPAFTQVPDAPQEALFSMWRPCKTADFTVDIDKGRATGP